MSLSQIPPMSSSLMLDRLSVEDEIHYLGFMTFNVTAMHTGLTVSSE